MGLLDLTGPLTVFWSASKFMEERGRVDLRHFSGAALTARACRHLPQETRARSENLRRK